MHLIVSIIIGIVFSIIEVFLFEENKKTTNWIKVIVKNLFLNSLTSLKIIEFVPASIMSIGNVFSLTGFTAGSLLCQALVGIVWGFVLLFVTGVLNGAITFSKDEYAKKKHIKVIKIISAVLVFLGVLAWRMTIWTETTYGEITPDQMLINITSPTTGTSNDIIFSMLEGPLFKTLLYSCWIDAFIFVSLKIVYSRKGKKITLFSSKIQRFISLILAVLVLVGGISIGVKDLQLKDLYYAYTVKSDYIEKNYVDPETAKITFPEKKRNLIHIYLESMENSYASKDIGGYMDTNLIPELTELLNEGISFSDRDKGMIGGPIQATGSQWSVAAMVCMGTGLPMKVPSKRNRYGSKDNFLPGAYTIGDILKAQGYEQTVMFGSSAAFGGLNYYYESHGDFKVMGYDYMLENGILPKDYEVWWGYEDEKLFEFAKEEITRLSETGKPFDFVMETADTHFPDGYLSEKAPTPYESQYANVIAYSSSQVEQFVRWIQQQPFYSNTTIVIIGDHASMDPNFFKDFDPGYRRTVYNVILNPDESMTNVAPDRLYNREYASFDVMPTILASLGAKIEGDRLGIGTNLFSQKKTVFETDGVEYVNEELKKGSDLYTMEIMR